MLHRKKIFATVLLCSVMLLVSGCYKNRTVIVSNTPEVTKTVSFASDILPIFTKDCAVSGCHASGGKAPDLSAANAYSSLTSGGYIDTGSPESSGLYQWMAGKKSTPMPLSGINSSNNALVLAWIKQGAKNN